LLNAVDTGTVADKRKAFIVNDMTWRDTASHMIYTHDDTIARSGNMFYWYGTSYAGNLTGLYGIVKPRHWNGVQCYGADDLVDWKYEGDEWALCHLPRYVWLPLTFDPATETATVTFRKKWDLFYAGVE
jgi:hypothetical protein